MFLRSAGILLVSLVACVLTFAQAQRPEVYVQQGPDTVTTVSISPDGRLLATGSRSVQSDVVRLYDLKARRELRTLRHFEVQSLTFSPDGRWLATAGKEEKQTPVTSQFGNYLKTVYSVRVWDVATGKLLRTIATSDSAFHNIAFSPDGLMLATSSAEPMKLWDVAGKAEPRIIPGKSSALRIAFAPNGKTLAGETYEHSVKLWDVATGTEKKVLAGHKENIHALRFSPNGKILASGSYDKSLRLWDVETGVLKKTLADKKTVEDVVFAADGETFWSVSSDKVRRWNASTGEAQDLFSEPSTGLSVARFSTDGKTLISAGYQEVFISDIPSAKHIYTFTKRGSDICALWMLSDEKTRLLVAEDFTKSYVWDYTAGEFRNVVEGKTFCNSGTGQLSPDYKLVATGDQGGVALYDAKTKSPLRKLETGQSYLSTYSFAFSPDSQLLAADGMDGVTKILNVATGNTISSINHNAPPKKIELVGGISVTDPASMFPNMAGRMAFSPDSKILAGAVSDSPTFANLIIFWDTWTGRELRRLSGHEERATALAFNSDGKSFASGDGRGVIKVWDAATGKEIHTFPGHKGSVSALLFAQSDLLISGGGDAQIKLWDLTSGSELVSLVSVDRSDWLAVAPDGLFDGSPPAWNQVLWRFSQDLYDVAPVEVFFSEYFYPNLLADILAGKRPKAGADITEKDRRQPRVSVAINQPASSVASTSGRVSTSASRTMTVRIDVAEASADGNHVKGSGVVDVRLFRNGSLVKVWRGEAALLDGNATLEATIPLVAGENRLTAYAFNRDSIKSDDAKLIINGAASLQRQGKAYVLAVGVNSYSNARYNLRYAVADAQSFGAQFKANQDQLGRFESFEIATLVDHDATKERILKAISDLATRVQPEDAVIIYFAGHGTAQGKRFYLIPHDLGYTGERTKLDRTGLQTILEHSVSDKELETALAAIDAGQMLLVIDACNSGQALEAEEKRRGPMNSKGLAQLAYEKGMYILTAAQSYQAAQEASRLGHGYLTYALVEEGLKTDVSDRAPKDGQVLLREWLDFATGRVPEMQQEKIDEQQKQGRQLEQVIKFADADAGANRSIQRPRVFYRREAEVSPLVVAKP